MISIAYKVERYRELLKETVQEDDVVLEIGPHEGESTKAYLEKAKKVILVDKSDQAKRRIEPISQRDNVRFVQGDVRKFSAMRKVLKVIQECDLFTVDMGGGRYPDTVFKVWATWSGVFKPRDSILRNRGLGEFLQRAKIQDPYLEREFPEDGWLSSYGRTTPYQIKGQIDELKFYVNPD